jgi:hypothetical protein
MRLTKEHYKMYMDFFVSKIDGENYEKELKTEKEKISFVLDCFVSEKLAYERRNLSKQILFAEWLSGLPSCVDIPFMNYDIIELAVWITGEMSEKEKNRVLENYWIFMVGIFRRLCKKHKIKF